MARSSGPSVASHARSVRTYGDLVFSRISRIPTWLSLVLGGVGVAGLAILPSLLPSWGGVGALIATVILGLCVVLAVAAPTLQHVESERAKRLLLTVQISDRPVPTWEDVPAAVRAVAAAEEASVLQSLRDVQAAQKRTAAADNPERTTWAKAGSLTGVSMKELKRLLERDERGEVLSATEAATLADYRATAGSFYKAAASALSKGMGGQSETRTAEAFEGEARKYAGEVLNRAREAVRIAYVSEPTHAFCVTITNPTPRTLEEVEFEVYIPGKFAAHEGRERLDERDLDLPTRPWPYGKGQAPRLRLDTAHLLPGISRPIQIDPGAPTIDNSQSARITYAPVTIRPESSAALRAVWLITGLPTGTRLQGSWEATARNAEGKLTGQFEVRVGDPWKAEPVLRRLVSYDPA